MSIFPCFSDRSQSHTVSVRILVVAVLSVLTGCVTDSGSGSNRDLFGTDSTDASNSGSFDHLTLDPNCALSDFAKEMLSSINQYRSSARSCGSTPYSAAPALTWNCQLELSSRRHANDMGSNNFHDHMSSNGQSMSDRINATGYEYMRIAENIAAGQNSVDAVMQGWINSPGHCANIMNPKLTEVGAATVYYENTDYGRYWTQNFGTPRG